jgi:hypothetical protein
MWSEIHLEFPVTVFGLAGVLVLGLGRRSTVGAM